MLCVDEGTINTFRNQIKIKSKACCLFCLKTIHWLYDRKKTLRCQEKSGDRIENLLEN